MGVRSGELATDEHGFSRMSGSAPFPIRVSSVSIRGSETPARSFSRTLYIAVSERACPEPVEGPGCCACTRLRCASSSSPKARMRAFAASSHAGKGKGSKQRVLLQKTNPCNKSLPNSVPNLRNRGCRNPPRHTEKNGKRAIRQSYACLGNSPPDCWNWLDVGTLANPAK